MTKRQIEKELTRQATLFEENCKLGNVSVERYTFQEYAEYALNVKVQGGMSLDFLGFKYIHFVFGNLGRCGPLGCVCGDQALLDSQ